MAGVVPGGPFRHVFEVEVFGKIGISSVCEGGHEVSTYPGGGPSLHIPVSLAFVEKVDSREGIYSLVDPGGDPFFTGVLGSPMLFHLLP